MDISVEVRLFVLRAVAGNQLELRVVSLRPRDLAACCGQLLLRQVRALEKARQV